MAMMTRKRRRMMAEAAAAAATAVLPEELMIEILARVRVSNPLQLRCVCKRWKSLVVDPQFVKKHLYKSFSDITDLASKAMEDMNAFQLQLSYAPALAEQEQEEGEEEEEEEEEARSLVNELAQLDNMLVVVRSLKGSLETIKVDVQAIKDRVKCLQSFLQIYLKTVSSSSV
ncbi:putative F-box protein [Spatholobus suberectus]|nr:putative F-box protein [Spatholobus suberectus]